MKTIKYDSETMLPCEIAEMISVCMKRIQGHPAEDDKVNCDMSHLKGELIRWFADKQI